MSSVGLGVGSRDECLEVLDFDLDLGLDIGDLSGVLLYKYTVIQGFLSERYGKAKAQSSKEDGRNVVRYTAAYFKG